LLAGGAILLALAAGLQPPALLAQPSVQGQWRTLSYLMPINPIHLALTHDGKVLVVAGSGNLETETIFRAVVWDPAADDSFVQHTFAWDMFCNGMSVLPDGRVFINGGNLQYDPFFGEPRNAAYDPVSGTFSDLQNMADGRWYPTVTTLGNGSVMTFSGLKATGGTNTTVEIYTPGAGWSQPSAAGWTPPLYPRMHLSTDGRVFYSGSGRSTRFFTPGTMTWSTTVYTTKYSGSRSYGTSVLLPLTPANGYRPRVMILGGGNPSTATTEIIDLSAAPPVWQFGPSMSQPRIQMNATILPNGKVLVVGGSYNDEDAATASLNADLYDPGTNTFSSAGANVYPRLYHSGSLLLPDGTVMLVGGNPTRGSYEQHIEIYSPSYLFDTDGTPATRPTISGVTPGAFGYGQVFQVQTPDPSSIASVVLVRPGAQTHAFDMEQRLVGLSFSVGAGLLNVTAPPHGNIAPPGYYMLFVVNAAGIPSVASFVHVGGAQDSTPPSTVTGLTATAVSTTQINLSWAAATDNVGVTGYRVERCQGAGCSNFVQIATPATTSYSDPGRAAATSYSYRVKAVDGAGNVSVSYSNVASATTPAAPDTTPPGAPGTLTATATGTQMALSWGAATDNVGVTGYRVERCQGAGCSIFTQVATPTGLTYTDIGLTPSTSYSYRVRATDAATLLGPYSNIASATTGSAPATPPGLVAGYAFEEGTGTSVSDASGNNNGGTLAAGTTWTAQGRFGSALQFSGTTSGVTVADANSLDLTTGMTVEAWVFPTIAPAGWRAVVGKDVDRYYLMASSNTNLPIIGATFSPGGNLNTYAPSALAVNTWTHLAATYDGTTVRLFVDGVQVATRAQSGALTTSTSPLTIGHNFYGERFTGRIDEVRVYNRALSVAEIQSDMNSAVGGAPAPDTTPPSTVTGLSATAVSATQINLSWAAATDNVGVTGYRVERCQGAGCSNFVQIATPATTSYSDPGRAAATSYSYRVKAVDAASNVSVNYSNVASATTQAAPDTQAPTVPTNVVATATSSSTINLTWTASTDNVGVTGYRVERCAGVGCSTFMQVGTPTSASFGDTGLTANTSYSYRVRAADAVPNLSGYSTVASATTQAAADTQAPTVPTNVVATATSSSAITVTWTASTDNVGVTGYRVERCAGVGCSTFTQVGTPAGPSFANTGLNANTSYSYRVRAADAVPNLSGYSTVASATTPAAPDTTPPSTVSGLNATAVSVTQINLSWAAATDNVGVTGYRVERCQGSGCSNFVQIATPATTSYSDQGLAASTRYRYRVKAVDAAGNVSVNYSNIATARTRQ
jgi:fibronectin type 3 domain-containing protein